MTKLQANPDLPKSKGLIILEYILLGLCLCVIALRVTLTEAPNAQSAGQPLNFGDSVYSLSVSAVLILSFVLWLVWSFCSKRFLYRFTAIEIGLCLFCLASVIAFFPASNKRAAVTAFAVTVAPILMAVLLVQILDYRSKIELVLAVIAALGIVSTYQCAEQFFLSNQIMIEQYKTDPQSLLEPLGIRSGTFAHMLFEHRLFSRGIRGFFTTSNSAGAFSLLAFFSALILFLEKFRNRKSSPSPARWLVISGSAVAIVMFGLALTRSKGAIAASGITMTMFVMYLLFGGWLKVHKKTVLIVCLLAVIAGSFAVVSYGLTHDRLPGGNSMLVRWQYWRAAAKMYADHPLKGVGPGNFVHFYPHYKPASALETVADPHNFLLSIITQYGPLGLIGFLALVFIPLWRIISSGSVNSSPKAYHPQPTFKKSAFSYLFVISLGLLLIRPVITPVAPVDRLDVMIYVIFTLYIAPVIVFIVGFLLLMSRQASTKTMNYDIAVAALFCAVVGLLVHNLIDFAIFEPGVFTAFWAIMACLIASDLNRKSQPLFVLKPALFTRVLVVAGGLVIAWAYLHYALTPVSKAATKTRQALRQAGFAHQLLAHAAEDDPLDPNPLNLNGRLYVQHYNDTGKKQPDLLKKAVDCFRQAIVRNEADFKNYEKLTVAYNLLAEASSQQAKTDWLNLAFDSASRAAERYRGCARLHLALAEVAEQLGKTDIALQRYKKAVDIEDSYRRQFQLMYPGREIFSRLGEQKYQTAKHRIKQLTEKPTP